MKLKPVKVEENDVEDEFEINEDEEDPIEECNGKL